MAHTRSLKSWVQSKSLIFTFALAIWGTFYSPVSSACLPPLRNNPEYIVDKGNVWFQDSTKRSEQDVLYPTKLNPKNLTTLKSNGHMAKAFANDGRHAYMDYFKLVGGFDVKTLKPIEINAGYGSVYWPIFKDRSSLFHIQDVNRQNNTITLVKFAPALEPEQMQLSVSAGDVIFLADKKNDVRYSLNTSGTSLTKWSSNPNQWKESQYGTYTDGQAIYQPAPYSSSEIIGLKKLGSISEIELVGVYRMSETSCGTYHQSTSAIVFIKNGKLYWEETEIGDAHQNPIDNKRAVLDYIEKSKALFPLPEKLKEHSYIPQNPRHITEASLVLSDDIIELYTQSTIKAAMDRSKQ